MYFSQKVCCVTIHCTLNVIKYYEVIYINLFDEFYTFFYLLRQHIFIRSTTTHYVSIIRHLIQSVMKPEDNYQFVEQLSR